jgi:hypothetical protein
MGRGAGFVFTVHGTSQPMLLFDQMACGSLRIVPSMMWTLANTW